MPSKAANQRATEDNTRERTRRRYKPDLVHILFVGEAPPASGLFFYDANSGLYRAIRDTFLRALPSLSEATFLADFRHLGCYLVDLCGEPVDQLGKALRKRACSEGEPRLAKTIRNLKPKLIISVVRSIQTNVNHACEQAHFSGQHINLPYPGRWIRHRVEFENALAPILQREFGQQQSPTRPAATT